MDKPSTTGRIFTIIIAVLLGLVLLFGTFWLPVQKVLLQPAVYQQALQDQGFFEVYPQIATSVLAGESTSKLLGSGLGQLTTQLNQETLNQFIFDMIPPQWFQDQVNKNFDLVFAFLNGSTDTLALSIDLEGIKSNMGEEGSIRNLIQLLPPCTVSDLGKLLSLLGGEGNIPLCRFTDEVMGAIFPIIKPVLINFVGQVPDQIPLTNISMESDNTPSTVKTIVGFTRNASSITVLIFVLSLILFVALILISKPGWKIKLRNCGIVLLTAGSVGLFLDLLLWFGVNSSAEGTIRSAASSFSGELVDVITGIYLQVANNYITVAALVGFVILVCGVILFVVSRSIFKDQLAV